MVPKVFRSVNYSKVGFSDSACTCRTVDSAVGAEHIPIVHQVPPTQTWPCLNLLRQLQLKKPPDPEVVQPAKRECNLI